MDPEVYCPGRGPQELFRAQQPAEITEEEVRALWRIVMSNVIRRDIVRSEPRCMFVCGGLRRTIFKSAVTIFSS
jgi:hypothetical protein